MKNKIFAFVIAGTVLVIMLYIFPATHTMLNNVDTTGFSYLLGASVTFLPYIFVFIGGYLVYRAAKGDGNK